MPQLLFVDACVRGAESRSRMLAERFLSSYAAANPDAAILRRDLMPTEPSTTRSANF